MKPSRSNVLGLKGLSPIPTKTEERDRARNWPPLWSRPESSEVDALITRSTASLSFPFQSAASDRSRTRKASAPPVTVSQEVWLAAWHAGRSGVPRTVDLQHQAEISACFEPFCYNPLMSEEFLHTHQ